MTKIEKLDQFLETRGIRVIHKEDSQFMKVLGWVLHFICPDFMENYATSFWGCIWVPQKMWNSLEVRCHEYTHIYDMRDEGNLLYDLRYLFPQILSLLSLGALAAIWCSNYFLFFLVALIFLAPWRAKYRRLYELRGYKMSVAVRAWEGLTTDVNWIVKNCFESSSYYWMGSKDVYSVLMSTATLARQGKSLGQPYDTVYGLLFAPEVIHVNLVEQ